MKVLWEANHRGTDHRGIRILQRSLPFFNFLTVAQTVIMKCSRVSRSKFSDRTLLNNYRELKSRISTNLDVNLYLMQPPTNHPPTISTYLIFNQLRIVHPQFRPKSRSSVLEPSQNILSNAFSYLVLTIVIEYSIVVVRARSKEEAVCRRGPHKLWLKRATIRLLSYFRRFNRNLRESLLVIF
ncbi:protein artichoke [Vespula squamosa]|uniref:Protein artichoke n=2 Tax=Vespula squamosa TaxID=30214 RepID=A0ABD2AD51_VESSQ